MAFQGILTKFTMTVRKAITENIVKQKLGHKSYPLMDEEAYIFSTKEIEGSNVLPRDTNTISNEIHRYKWIKAIHICGAFPVNNKILFFGGHDSSFDDRPLTQM